MRVDVAFALLGVLMWCVYWLSPKMRMWLHRPDGDEPAPEFCAACRHVGGLDSTGQHCVEVDEVGGWTSSACLCTDDYHWTYEIRDADGSERYAAADYQQHGWEPKPVVERD